MGTKPPTVPGRKFSNVPNAEVRDRQRATAGQRLRSSAAGSQVHAPGQEAVIGSPGLVPAAMTAVGGEAVIQADWPPLSELQELVAFGAFRTQPLPALARWETTPARPLRQVHCS